MHKKLATTSQYTRRCQLFDQDAWRAQFYPSGQGHLCSALTSFWLKAKIAQGNPLRELLTPDNRLLQDLTRLQLMSYYPDFPDHYIPGDQDSRLLKKKYGTSDWTKIQNLVNSRYQSDFVLYDLAQLFAYQVAMIRKYKTLPSTLSDLDVKPGTAIVAVLRYLSQGKPDGHRVAYYQDENRQHHIFDPNTGENIEQNPYRFIRWLDRTLNNNIYLKKRPSDNDNFLTLYILTEVESSDFSGGCSI